METYRHTLTVLFDLDGVILDTETQYTRFWDEQGSRYLGVAGYGHRIKGQTLTQIYAKDFAGKPDLQAEISRSLQRFENEMSYEYIPGVQAFIADLRGHRVSIAVVTSSDEAKMEQVYRAHPGFAQQFDRILTAGMFTRSKPAPDCFLLGMELFNATPEQTFVFEDSFHGLQAGRDSGAIVVGLATTHTREVLDGKAHYLIDDFRRMTYAQLLAWSPLRN